jgi:hypothetical protein
VAATSAIVVVVLHLLSLPEPHPLPSMPVGLLLRRPDSLSSRHPKTRLRGLYASSLSVRPQYRDRTCCLHRRYIGPTILTGYPRSTAMLSLHMCIVPRSSVCLQCALPVSGCSDIHTPLPSLKGRTLVCSRPLAGRYYRTQTASYRTWLKFLKKSGRGRGDYSPPPTSPLHTAHLPPYPASVR